MAVTTLSTQIFQYREDVGNPPVTVSTGTVVQNPMAANGISIASGGTSTVVGAYQIVTFTGSGSFTVNQTGNVELMMIGGGGGGGYDSSSQVSTNYASGGASSGGVVYYGSNSWPLRAGTSIELTGGTTYTVTIGAGGNNTGYFNANGSTTYGNITTISYSYGGNTTLTGGSINLVACGGSCWFNGFRAAPGAGSAGLRLTAAGLGNSGSLSTSTYVYGRIRRPFPNQGYDGGEPGDYNSRSLLNCGPGGGGAGGRGGRGSSIADYGGNTDNGNEYTGIGGNGFYTDISGTFAYYGGGGGGGTTDYNVAGTGVGGLGGGGNGASRPGSTAAGVNATAGSPNTGGGGGGGGKSTSPTPAYYMSAATGGSGVVIMKIPLYSISTDAITTAQNNLIATGNTATGGSITYSGNYRIHTFTGSGTFTAAHLGYIEYLVIGGGGSGGNGNYNASGGAQANGTGGGGGGGGFLENYSTSTPGTDFQGARIFVNPGDSVTVVVGAGGAYPTGYSYGSNELGVAGYSARNGSDSLIRNTSNKTEVIAYGGGGGGTSDSLSVNNGINGGWYTGQRGGSGGGAAYSSQNLGSTYIYVGGPGGSYIGSTGGVRQGYPGKTSVNSSTPSSPVAATAPYYGGGAGADGASGGAGRASTITGSSVTYAAGGGQRATVGDTATANSGNGGVHGTASLTLYAGANGGSGIVIIRYRFQ